MHINSLAGEIDGSSNSAPRQVIWGGGCFKANSGKRGGAPSLPPPGKVLTIVWSGQPGSCIGVVSGNSNKEEPHGVSQRIPARGLPGPEWTLLTGGFPKSQVAPGGGGGLK